MKLETHVPMSHLAQEKPSKNEDLRSKNWVTRIIHLFRKSTSTSNYLVGIGGGGSNMIDFFSSKLPTSHCLVLSHKPVATSAVVEMITSQTDMETLYRKCFSASAHYVLCAGLGGNFSSIHILKLVEWMNKNHKSYMVVTSLPFGFEGRKRKEQSMAAHEKLKDEKKYFSVPLDHIFTTHANEKMGVSLDFFHEQLWQLIEKKLP